MSENPTPFMQIETPPALAALAEAFKKEAPASFSNVEFQIHERGSEQYGLSEPEGTVLVTIDAKEPSGERGGLWHHWRGTHGHVPVGADGEPPIGIMEHIGFRLGAACRYHAERNPPAFQEGRPVSVEVKR